MSTSTAKQMNLNQTFISEIKYEAATSRKILERIPAKKFDWKPHEKSMSFGRLAVHIPEMFDYIPLIINKPEIDFAVEDYNAVKPETTDEMLAYFDECIGRANKALENASDETFFENWAMKDGDTVYFTMPKIQCIRAFCLNHIYHHRGQLSVYLRMNDIPVPSVYGPSADESPF